VSANVFRIVNEVDEALRDDDRSAHTLLECLCEMLERCGDMARQ
jgi:hypothetical protein